MRSKITLLLKAALVGFATLALEACFVGPGGRGYGGGYAPAYGYAPTPIYSYAPRAVYAPRPYFAPQAVPYRPAYLAHRSYGPAYRPANHAGRAVQHLAARS